MSITLYGTQLSPFVRKVRLCLIEKALDYQLETVLPFSPPEWYLQLNPLGRIPALKDGDLTLADSSVICQYLEEAYPQTQRLYGSDAAQRAQVRWLEKYADYELAPLTTFGIFRNRILKPSTGHPCNEDSVQAILNEKLPPHFNYLESQLGDSEYFVGSQLSLADIAVACQLINLNHGGEQVDAERWPGLAAHFSRMTERTSLAALLPEEHHINGKLISMGKQAVQP